MSFYLFFCYNKEGSGFMQGALPLNCLLRWSGYEGWIAGAMLN